MSTLSPTALPWCRTLVGAMWIGLAPACLAGDVRDICPSQDCGVFGVVHAAGVPPDLAQKLGALRFKGSVVDEGALQGIVLAAKTLPTGSVMRLTVKADAGLPATAAAAQSQARARSLASGLAKAGLAASRFTISAN